jgi:DNA-binding HxlR family transcriptional regulator
MALLDLLGRRWALRVIWELREEPAPTFRGLQLRCGGISSSVLTDRLRELGEAGLVRHDGEGYVLRPSGRELLSALQPLEQWASRWRPETPEK